jgi:hypothetical protein
MPASPDWKKEVFDIRSMSVSMKPTSIDFQDGAQNMDRYLKQALDPLASKALHRPSRPESEKLQSSHPHQACQPAREG